MDPGSEAAASSNHGMVLLYREQNRVERHGRKRAERKKGRGGERSGAAGSCWWRQARGPSPVTCWTVMRCCARGGAHGLGRLAADAKERDNAEVGEARA